MSPHAKPPYSHHPQAAIFSTRPRSFPFTLDLIPFRVEAGSRGRGIPQGAQRLRICRESPLTPPERPSLWLWGWERRERSDRRPQPPSLTAASAEVWRQRLQGFQDLGSGQGSPVDIRCSQGLTFSPITRLEG